jgi:uncharacterized protein (AIM24 family)
LANIFWNGKKEPQDKVVKALTKKAVDVWNDAFHVHFNSGILELVVEMEDTDNATGLWKEFKEAKFMGYQFHILKVPKGSIRVFYKEKKHVRHRSKD